MDSGLYVEVHVTRPNGGLGVGVGIHWNFAYCRMSLKQENPSKIQSGLRYLVTTCL